MGDIQQPGAKKKLMFFGDIRNNGNKWRDHVGGIQSSTHANFHDGDVSIFPGKIGKCHGRGGLKKGGRFLMCRGISQFLDQVCCFFSFNFHTVNPEALCKPDQMRRSVQTYPETRFFQYGCYKGSYRAFTICSSNVDIFLPFVGISEGPQQVGCL